jgi:hypothetical protein
MGCGMSNTQAERMTVALESLAHTGRQGNVAQQRLMDMTQVLMPQPPQLSPEGIPPADFVTAVIAPADYGPGSYSDGLDAVERVVATAATNAHADSGYAPSTPGYSLEALADYAWANGNTRPIAELRALRAAKK